eukprot:jgi/Picre1/29565/NNA_004951.t1
MNENAIKEFVQRATEHKCPGEEVEHRDILAVKRLGKISHGNIRKLFNAILDRLQANNSQIRLCALELWTALFERSSLFRDLACRKLDLFLDNVIGCRRQGALPEPQASAEELKHCGLRSLKHWHQRYAEVLPRLRIAYRYLESSGLIESPQIASVVPERVDSRREQLAEGTSSPDAAIISRELQAAIAEFRSKLPRWKILLEELKNARNILDGKAPSVLPAPVGTEEVSEDDWEDVQEGSDNGLGSYSAHLLDGYREATSQAIPCLQSIVRTCQQHVGSAEAGSVLREAAEINSDIVAICMEYQEKFVRELRNGLNGAGRASSSSQTAEQQGGPSAKPHNPMQMINDPTAPRARVSNHYKLQRVQAKDQVSRGSSSDKAVLKKLAEVAPIVASSSFARVWDSDAPPVYAGSHAMEVSNHWGPVDVHQELPKDRLDALFLVDQSNIQYKNHPSEEQCQPARKAIQPSRYPKETPYHGDTSIVNSSSLSSKEKRKAERLYNEQILREASQPAHLSSLEDLPSRMSSDQRNNKIKHKLSVQQRLAKKLKLKK